MTEEEIRKLITTEFEIKTFGVTDSYLELYEAVYENDVLKIDRLDDEGEDALIIAYLPVKDEYFSFAVHIDPIKREILNISTESRNLVSLRVESETLSSKQLKSFTKLIPTRNWNNGDLKPNNRTIYKFSRLEFNPNPEPDEVEDKLKKLLSYLATDKNGILKLAENAHAYVQIYMDFHGGNQILGGPTVDLESITKLHELNLSISFDVAAWGNPFK